MAAFCECNNLFMPVKYYQKFFIGLQGNVDHSTSWLKSQYLKKPKDSKTQFSKI